MEISPASSITTLPSTGPQSQENLAPSQSVLDQALDLLMDDLAKHKYPEGKVNVVEALQEFWEQRRTVPQSGMQPGIRSVAYESEVTDGPPFNCFVTLPCGACFASNHPCQSKAEARRSAARVALLNSVVDEHESRRISNELIDEIIKDLKATNSETKVVIRQALATHEGMGLLLWEAQFCTLKLLHWNGSIKAMRDRGATRDQVLGRYSGYPLEDNTRSQIALDWMAREERVPGSLARELVLAEEELKQKRVLGRELRFEKERRDILILAQRQIVVDTTSRHNLQLEKSESVA